MRSDACVSIYMAKTPLTQKVGKSRIRLLQLVTDAVQRLETAYVDKRRIWALQEHFNALLEDEDFWEDQAHSLVVLTTPDRLWTFRLPNGLTEIVTVADRFHLKPLLCATTFANSTHVLADSENDVRLIEVPGELPAGKQCGAHPQDAGSTVGKTSTQPVAARPNLDANYGEQNAEILAFLEPRAGDNRYL